MLDFRFRKKRVIIMNSKEDGELKGQLSMLGTLLDVLIEEKIMKDNGNVHKAYDDLKKFIWHHEI